MKPVTEISGRAIPLDRSDVDTDQIIPASYLKRVERTGFGEGLFASWRENDKTFVLNRPEFEGASVLHWAKGAEGRGIVCAGDTLMVTADRKFLSFMRSYPNLIPLSRRSVETIAAALAPYAFDRIYGLAWDRVIERDAKAMLARSVTRYLEAISD